MQFIAEYGIFLLKIVTVVAAILILIAGIASIATRGKSRDKLVIKKINDKYHQYKDALQNEILTKTERKTLAKEDKRTKKAAKKSEHQRRKIFVVNFIGDVKAGAVKSLREEITSILLVATPRDEVVVRLESPGGMVHAYGLAASQLDRLKQKNIPLTVAVDKVAASGGYLMACVANQIIAAPFAIVGSIGVIAQLPNFHRYLKKKDIDFEQVMAGEYKRTLTVFGENTKKGREKLQEEVEDIQKYFKEYIAKHRPQVNVDQVATGEHWIASQALPMNLVDRLQTSDDYLLHASNKADLYQVSYCTKKGLSEKLSSSMDAVLTKFWVWQSERFN